MNVVRHEPGAILSQATEYGSTVYLAGIVAKNLKADVRGQTAEILAELDRLLEQCGSHRSRILQAQIWVTDIRNRPALNEVWEKWIDAKNPPPRACVEAKLADPNALVEIMVIAAK